MDRDGSGRSRSTPFSKISKGVSRSFEMGDVGSLLLVLELDDKVDFINDIERTVSCVEI